MKKRSVCSVAFLLVLVWLSMAFADYSAEFAYIGSYNDNSIMVMDLGTGSYFKISNIFGPSKIFTTPDYKLAYVQRSGGSAGIDTIDITTHSIKFPSSWGPNFQTMVFKPDSQLMYTGLHNNYQAFLGGQCDYGGGLVTVKTQSMETLGCIDFGSWGPSHLSVRPDGQYIYAHFHYDQRSSIRILRQDSLETVPAHVGYIYLPIPVTYSMHRIYGMSQSKDGNFLYVIADSWVQGDDNLRFGYLYKIDMSTNMLVNYVSFHLAYFREIKITATGYASIIDSPNRKFYVIDLADYSNQRIISFDQSSTNSIKNLLISRDGNFAYILDSKANKVIFVDVANAAVLGEVTVGTNPYEMALSSDGTRLYVTNYGANNISVIGTGSRSIVASYPATYPRPIALIPPANQPPQANAGADLAISSSQQALTKVCGQAFDADGDPLTFRWMKGDVELSTWQSMDANGEGCLDLGAIGQLSQGSHTLTLEVRDGALASSDTMTLTIGNSTPSLAPAGAGIYYINSPVTLKGEVSDFDGDVISFIWSEGTQILFSGSIASIPGAVPVSLPEFSISGLSLGEHVFTLTASDTVNPQVIKNIIVQIVDTSAPTLAPVANCSILWPPNHKMMDIQIDTHTADNSGAVTISADIFSSEPEEGLGDGDMAPDWTEPIIDQNTGVILLSLRAERSGLAEGRVYTVKITAVDGSGNFSSADVEFVVPHDMRIK